MIRIPRAMAIAALFAWNSHAGATDWPERFRKGMAKVNREFKGNLGIYVKDLNSGLSVSLAGDDWWYLASTVKLFVLIEVARGYEAGRIQPEHKVRVEKASYRDGAGRINWLRPGSVTTVRHLTELMMMESDNAATDLLIDLVGVERINRRLTELLGQGRVGPVTSMLDVRRLAYGELHPAAARLTHMDFFKLKGAASEAAKLELFLKLTKLKRADLKLADVGQAFERYYQKGFNSGPLAAMGEILEKLARGEVITAARSRQILDLMARCNTGKDRLAAGLPKGARWMHKTGTQMNRICDIGLVEPEPSRFIVVAACAKNFAKNSDADRALRRAAEALTRSGIFDKTVNSTR